MTRFRAVASLYDASQRAGINLFAAQALEKVCALPEATSLKEIESKDLLSRLRSIDVALSHRTQSQIQLVASVPEKIRLDSQVPMTEETLAQMVAGANHDLLVLAFELKSKTFRERLATFLRRPGRLLRIVIDHRVGAAELKQEVINWDAPETLEIWQYVKRKDLGGIDNNVPGIMHAKVVVADRRDCLVGSANFTDSALNNLNFELGVRFPSEPIAATLWRTTEQLPSQLFTRIC